MLSESDLRERVLEMVARARRDCEEYRNPLALARSLGLRVDFCNPQIDLEGIHVEGTIVLSGQESKTPGRVRFTFYHEICHHLIRQDEELWSELHDQFALDNNFDAVVERLCNLGAAEFLLPRSRILTELQTEGVSVGLIERLRVKFEASRLATAIQIADHAPHACIMVAATRIQIPEMRRPLFAMYADHCRGSLVVEHAMPSRRARYTVGRHSPIRFDSLVAYAESSDEGRVISGRDFVPFRSGKKWEVEAEAVRLGSRIYSLFHLEPPCLPAEGQLRLF